jgi:poly-gamma-glutamate synthesis protein (capsule biosynthesis protein)
MFSKKTKTQIFIVPLIILLSIIISTFLLLIWNLNRPSLIKKEVGVALNSPINTRSEFEFENRNLSLNEIFEGKPGWLKNLPESKTSTLIATGDVMLGRSVNYSTVAAGDFNWPFMYVEDLLKDADITLINLEGTLLSECPLTNEGMKFCGNTRHVTGLVNAGVNIVGLANNHASDYGSDGINETKSALESSKILTVGLGSPTFMDVKDKTFAFLSYNSIFPNTVRISWADKEKIRSDIQTVKPKSDIIVVSFHWGNEYTSSPTKKQVELGHMAIDSGADLVVGHHPHWIQPVEIYKGKVILYSLGNFIFDQMWSQKTKEGVVGKFTFYEGELIDIELIPVLIEDYGQPKVLKGSTAKLLMDDIRTSSVLYQSMQP